MPGLSKREERKLAMYVKRFEELNNEGEEEGTPDRRRRRRRRRNRDYDEDEYEAEEEDEDEDIVDSEEERERKKKKKKRSGSIKKKKKEPKKKKTESKKKKRKSREKSFQLEKKIPIIDPSHPDLANLLIDEDDTKLDILSQIATSIRKYAPIEKEIKEKDKMREEDAEDSDLHQMDDDTITRSDLKDSKELVNFLKENINKWDASNLIKKLKLKPYDPSVKIEKGTDIVEEAIKESLKNTVIQTLPPSNVNKKKRKIQVIQQSKKIFDPFHPDYQNNDVQIIENDIPQPVYTLPPSQPQTYTPIMQKSPKQSHPSYQHQHHRYYSSPRHHSMMNSYHNNSLYLPPHLAGGGSMPQNSPYGPTPQPHPSSNKKSINFVQYMKLKQ
mmetsp:Transcript_11295/g.16714  ORF Transcript_11295/g.16714 Transcript_11295/m.16714 type:complete len:385 (+) Transcript_11295:55-1209(+)